MTDVHHRAALSATVISTRTAHRSFAGEPEVHHPVRGRLKGASAFGRFVTDMTSWMAERNITVEDVSFIVTPSGGSKNSCSTSTATPAGSSCRWPLPQTSTRMPA